MLMHYKTYMLSHVLLIQKLCIQHIIIIYLYVLPVLRIQQDIGDLVSLLGECVCACIVIR